MVVEEVEQRQEVAKEDKEGAKDEICHRDRVGFAYAHDDINGRHGGTGKRLILR